jgi:type II secretory pathway pseudopilin PulG
MADIYLTIDGNPNGPYQPEQLRQMLAAGQVSGTTFAWYEGQADWLPLSEVIAKFSPPATLSPPPPPARVLPPPPPKKSNTSLIVGLALVGAFFLLFIPCLAGIALGPITAGIKKAKQAASMQSARAISLAMTMYARDHNGTYPDGASSTEVFQKLLDGKYVSDPALFYFAMPGKTKPTSNKLLPENVSYDVTSGVSSDSSYSVPVVFLTGYKIVYAPGASATPNSTDPSSLSGITVAYKSNAARFIRALQNGTVPLVVPSTFFAGDHIYRQLTP